MAIKIFNGLKKNLLKIVILASVILIPCIALAQLDIPGAKPGTLTGAELGNILVRIIIYILRFIGLLGIIFLVYGGIRYVTSAGNDSEIEGAKNIITYAIWGLFIAASSYAIVKLVIATVG